MIDMRKLIEATVGFGHRTSVWNPKMEPYIWGKKNGIYLIDVSKTAMMLEKAAQFIESVTAQGKSVLWVGTKKSAQDSVLVSGQQLDMPYVNHRWVGGTLSNFSQVKKSVTKLLHFQDILDRAETEEFSQYTKKELNTFKKNVERLKKNVGGIVGLKWPLGAIVLVDVRKENSALREAIATGVPVVAIVDTNCDPSFVDYVIPGNDDAPRSVNLLINYLKEAAQRGKTIAEEKGAAAAAAAAAEEHAEEGSTQPSLRLEEEEESETSKRNKGIRKVVEEGGRKRPARRREDDDRRPDRSAAPRNRPNNTRRG